ncbi:MAG: histidinol-phosphate transaminase [Bacteroidetes bacterium]|nr:histidinol-phosphate transaminase [Bacteroidota bacterium]
MTTITKLVRKNILELKPYSPAREEYPEGDAVLLDANENPFIEPYNRYPDPYQRRLKEKIAAVKNVNTTQLFAGNGSDEAIDLLIRIFCEPRRDNIVIAYPTYGMYETVAAIQDVDVRKALLDDRFDIDTGGVLAASDGNSKLLFLCSPNNPTGNTFSADRIMQLAAKFPGIVVLDEAYTDFSVKGSLAGMIQRYPNLVVLQTFSKAWGLAGIRLGIAIADISVVRLMIRIKYPYNISMPTTEYALKALDNTGTVMKHISDILLERDRLVSEFRNIAVIEKTFPTDSNFILVKVPDAVSVYEKLKARQIIVRNRSGLPMLYNCLRITVGKPEENQKLIDSLKQM